MKIDIIKSVRDFISDSKRVLEVSYKPDQATFMRTVKIVLIGTIILGVLGFIVSEIISFITGA